jgi:hypothetical protein
MRQAFSESSSNILTSLNIFDTLKEEIVDSQAKKLHQRVGWPPSQQEEHTTKLCRRVETL